jgi:hypothetical protein
MKYKQPFFVENSSIPLPISGQCRLVLNMAQDTQCMSATGGGAVQYQCTSPRLLCPMIAYEQKFLDVLRQVAQKGGLLLCHVQNLWQGSVAVNAEDNVLICQNGAKNVLGAIWVNRIKANDTVLWKRAWDQRVFW